MDSSAKEVGNIILEEDIIMPPGFRFTPTEEELIGFFLLNKVIMGGGFDCFIEEKNIYEDAPWNIFTDDQNWSKLNVDVENNKKTQFYAFTRLKKTGKNVIRSSGCGKWHGQTAPKPVKYNDEEETIIGYKKMFIFELLNNSSSSNNNGAGEEQRWIMHEYSLDKDFLNKIMRLNNVSTDYDNNYVICHLTRYLKSKRII